MLGSIIKIKETASCSASVRKVGEFMTHREKIAKIAANNGVFRTADLITLGYNTYYIRKLVNEQVIERVKSGYYRLYHFSGYPVQHCSWRWYPVPHRAQPMRSLRIRTR